MREEREMEPKTLAHMVSSTLYEKRYVIYIHTGTCQWEINFLLLLLLFRFGPYFVEPIVAGLGKDNKPFICAMDLIGCINFAKDFVVSGTAGPNLYGMCESLWEPELEPEDLFETISQALLNAQDRDALSGWGAVVHIM